MIKRYAKNDYLEDLTNYIKDSDIIDLNDIWPTLMERYQFDVNTYNYDSNAPIWGLPKDIGPTVIFYNEDAFKAKGVTIISAKDGDNDEFVNYSGNTYKAVGYDKENNVFNNKIAMTFEENEALSSLLSNGSTNRDSHLTKWGFYSSWWFYAGWSVGGDVIQFKETTDASYHGGYWEFTLDDEIPNYRVSVDITINEHEYKIGDFIDYYDKSNISNKEQLLNEGKLIELPSMRETFEYWISYFKNRLSPKPEDISNQTSLFTNQDVAMYVDGRYQVVEFRKNANFAWDVAPLPRHADGISAGHSGSMCLSMSKKSNAKDKAFKIIEYLSGPIGQDALAEKGFNVPNQMSLAYDETKNFLNSTLRPYNNEIFLDAASYQRGGDWTYLADDTWIEIWAPTLNGDVLNGKKSIDDLFNLYKTTVNNYLKTYTKK